MRLAFMGTPDFSVPVLGELIAAGHEIAAVYSQPPRKAGRGQKEQPGPVHAFALKQGLEVRTPLNFKDPGQIEAFRALDLDAAVVVAYGLILPQAILEAPRHGCINLHASLLPRWRGAAPIQRAIEAGDTETGVMAMQMERGLDTGPILLADHVPIAARMTAGELHDVLSRRGADLMPRVLAALERGAVEPIPQPEEGVTYAHKIGKDECRIDWSRPAVEIDRHIRAMTPFPGAWFEAPCETGEQVRVKVLGAEPVSDVAVPPGTLPGTRLEGLTVACGEGALRIVRLQKAGKGACDAESFLRGFRFAGDAVLR